MEKKVVIITGGSSGMGKAMAKRQAELGWNVMITGRNQEALEETKKKLKPLRAKLSAFKWMSVLILLRHKWLRKR